LRVFQLFRAHMLLLDKETEDVILPFVAKKDKETSTLHP